MTVALRRWLPILLHSTFSEKGEKKGERNEKRNLLLASSKCFFASPWLAVTKRDGFLLKALAFYLLCHTSLLTGKAISADTEQPHFIIFKELA
jgi:hypothetical protein